MKDTFPDLHLTLEPTAPLIIYAANATNATAVNEIGVFASFVILEFVVIGFMGYFVHCIYKYIKFICQRCADKHKSNDNTNFIHKIDWYLLSSFFVGLISIVARSFANLISYFTEL